MEFKKKYGNTLPSTMVAVAFPETEEGGSPFVTADQQRLIDSITEKYCNKTDLTGLMEELANTNVHPSQIASNANYYIHKDGQIVDKSGKLVFNSLLDIVG